MGAERVDVLIGGGQAGLAFSYSLTEQGRDRLILEQGRLLESWRSKRWDALRLIAPSWSLRLPGFAYAGDDPHGFMGKEEVATHDGSYVELGVISATNPRQGAPEQGPTARGRVG
jgi:putative flavoprotein involved in K+ transport